ncbi:MAG: thioredoxin fold domain-containing protein [Verrucomicrobia bacterium]|nr:thioredoxin fold domain-containing protein [Verrucomicrobiota bacterium]
MNGFIAMGLAAAIGLSATAARAASDWEDDFGRASELAKKDGKYMLVDFSGSDWCGWCIKLDNEVFQKKAFKDYAKENLVLALVDFPRNRPLSKKDKARNDALAKKHGVRGFPTILVMSPEGEVVGKTGYQPGGPEAYVKHIREFVDAHKAKGGGAGAAKTAAEK